MSKGNKKQKTEQTNEAEIVKSDEPQIIEVRDPQEDEEEMEMYNIEDGENLNGAINECFIF